MRFDMEYGRATLETQKVAQKNINDTENNNKTLGKSNN